MYPPFVGQGKCRDAPNPDWWYPRQENDYSYRHARALCEACPVMQECREYALATRDLHGMWGATTPRQRRAILAGIELLTEWGGYHGDAPGTVRGYYREKRCGEKPCDACRAAFNQRSNERQKAARRQKNEQEQAA